MIEWLLLPGNQVEAVRSLLGRAWRGTAKLVVLRPTERSREISVVIPTQVAALREPRWPDVLGDWVDIYEEPLFPRAALPVAAEVISESGEDCLALHADLGAPAGARGGIAWYDKGGVVELELVASAAVAWRKGQPLSRPSAGGARAQLASLSRRNAGNDRDAGLYERVESGLAATAEAVLGRALLRLLSDDPPPLNELAAQVMAAPGWKLTV